MRQSVSLVIFAFFIGLFASDFKIIADAKADIFGMSYRELSRDRDFRKAVMRVIESNPDAVADAISGNCYIDNNYIYC